MVIMINMVKYCYLKTAKSKILQLLENIFATRILENVNAREKTLGPQIDNIPRWSNIILRGGGGGNFPLGGEKYTKQKP